MNDSTGSGETGGSMLVPVDRKRVLVADDERGIRDVFLHILRYNLPACRIDAVINGAEAVEAFRAVHYGLLLIDVKMPVMDGIAAFDAIMEICEREGIEKPSFVFCTGYEPSDELRKRIGNDTKHCVLRKPVRNEDLVNALKPRLNIG